MRSTTRSGLQALAVLLLFALCAACGGGGGGGGITPDKCISFLAADPAQTMSLASGVGSTCGTLNLNVRFANPSDLFGVEFTVNYPTAVADYATLSTAGSILASGGVTLIQLVDDDPGVLKVGLTRSSVGTGVTASGTQTVVTLVFNRVGTIDATGPITITAAKRFNSATPPQQFAVTGSGGTLVID